MYFYHSSGHRTPHSGVVDHSCTSSINWPNNTLSTVGIIRTPNLARRLRLGRGGRIAWVARSATLVSNRLVDSPVVSFYLSLAGSPFPFGFYINQQQTPSFSQFLPLSTFNRPSRAKLNLFHPPQSNPFNTVIMVSRARDLLLNGPRLTQRLRSPTQQPSPTRRM